MATWSIDGSDVSLVQSVNTWFHLKSTSKIIANENHLLEDNERSFIHFHFSLNRIVSLLTKLHRIRQNNQ